MLFCERIEDINIINISISISRGYSIRRGS